MHIAKKLLWIDCIAGATVGATVLMLSSWLSNLYALPSTLLRAMGIVSILYALYSFSLARRSVRPRWQINLLIFANFAWAMACLGMVFYFSRSASLYGISQFVGEMFFVGGLAALEWRWREQLINAWP